MSNHVSLAQLSDMATKDILNIPVDQIAMLLEDLSEMQAKAKSYAQILNSYMAGNFAGKAAEARKAAGKDTGTVRLTEGGFTIIADLPKKVVWDQKKLRDASEVVASWGEGTSEYIDTTLSVSETKFNAWPTPIRKVFEASRTVGTGTATFKLEAAKSEAI